LRIEHPITDYGVWKQAFDRFAGMREAAGVRAQAVRRPVDDPCYVLIDLDFDSAAEAGAFLTTLRTRVWSTPSQSPGLAGEPLTQILVNEESSAGKALDDRVV